MSNRGFGSREGGFCKKKTPLSRGVVVIDGADNGTRTRDPHLGKVMLYQLSHVRVPLYSRQAI